MTNQKVPIAILGCGGMAGAHAGRLRNHPEAEVVALCDVEETIGQGFLKRCLSDCTPPPVIYTDPATMYAEAHPVGVVIATPHTLHYAQGKQALEAGCHVLMEKPMVTDSSHAHELAQLAKQCGKVFIIGYNTPCTPELQYLRKLIKTGELGRLEVISGWLAQDWKHATRGTWRQNPALSGGGQMYDSGAHLLNSLVWTVEQPVSEVHAFADYSETPVDINGTINIRFANGTLATIMISGNCSNGGGSMVFCFENGRVDVDGWGGSWIRIHRRGEGEVKYPPITGKFQAPVDHFIDAILGRAEPLTNPLHGILQSELMDAVYASVRTGQAVRVQPR